MPAPVFDDSPEGKAARRAWVEANNNRLIARAIEAEGRFGEKYRGIPAVILEHYRSWKLHESQVVLGIASPATAPRGTEVWLRLGVWHPSLTSEMYVPNLKVSYAKWQCQAVVISSQKLGKKRWGTQFHKTLFRITSEPEKRTDGPRDHGYPF